MTKGSVLINGQACNSREIVARSGFVFQDASFHSCLKVKEVINFAASVKLPSVMSKQAKEDRVSLMLDLFDLRKIADSKVGDESNPGISGGEKRRLALCVETVDLPLLLFADEPLTGLDAASGLRMIQLLSAFAERGTTVIITLHQPRSAMLTFIDRFHVITDGRDVFCGSMDALYGFFEQTVELPIPAGCNPMDFVLDVVNNNPQMAEIVGSSQFAQLFDNQNRLVVFKDIANKVGDIVPLVKGAKDRSVIAELLEEKYQASGIFEKDSAGLDDENGHVPPKAIRASWLKRFGSLFHREVLQKLRNFDIASTELMFGVLVAIIFGTIYLRFPSQDTFIRSMASNWGTLLMGLIVFHICIIFPSERPLWRREYANGMYGSLEFYLATALAGMPGDIIGSAVFALIFYLLTTVEISASGLFTYIGFHILLACTFAALYYCAGAVSPSSTIANAVTSVLLVFVISLNGYFIPLSSIGWWWRWIAEINFLRFGNDAIFVTQVSCLSIFCWSEIFLFFFFLFVF